MLSIPEEKDKISIIDMAKKRSYFRHDLQTVVDLFVKSVTLSDKQQTSVGAVGSYKAKSTVRWCINHVCFYRFCHLLRF